MTAEAPTPPPTPKVVMNLGRPKSMEEMPDADQTIETKSRVVQGWRAGSAMLGVSGIETESVPDTSADEHTAFFKSLFGAKTDAVIDAEAKRKMTIGEVDITAGEDYEELAQGLKAYKGAIVTGFKHLSKKSILNSEFEKRDYTRRGTFGPGFYMGANNPIAKTDLKTIAEGDHFVEELKIEGNVLVMDLNSYALQLAASLLPEEIREEYIEDGETWSAASTLLDHPINGITYDAIIFYSEVETSDGPFITTEAITKKPEECVRIVNETFIPKPV